MLFFMSTMWMRLYAEVVARGAISHMPPTDQTWGTREIGIRDPDGNVLVFAVRPSDTK